VDHEKVVDSKNAVISDEALVALLDRTLQNDRTKGKEEDNSENSNSAAHLTVFKVIAERDSSGKLVGDQGVEDALCTDVTSASDNVDTDNINEGIATVPGDTSSLSTTPEPASSTSLGSSSSVSIASSSSADIQSDSLASTTPEPASSSSVKSSSSSVSLTSSSGSMCIHDVQSMDIDVSTPASSAALTYSCSPTPEPSTGGVMVANTEVNVCIGEMEVDNDKIVSSELQPADFSMS
jgi:hypothetical protein